MSHRTRHLPEVKGLHNFIRELRYHEASRQLLALAYMLLLTLLARPRSAAVYGIGMLLAGIGLLIRLWASGHVKKNKELATDGPYGFVRHPLYVGNILMLFGFALASGLWWAVPVLLFFLWFYYPPAIQYEDLKLERIFGDSWRQWSGNTLALWPRFAGRRFTLGGWSLHQSTFKNGEPIIVLYALWCGWYIYSRLLS
ncbi:MAG TPA: isoprenylcysteine carboxylmethyltransferase family protein [Gammaproteobacteria bacterium]|nr:isoprenylcysteine carboxylmethyltransferase family protein [Gammaproteobacteria bacterium]